MKDKSKIEWAEIFAAGSRCAGAGQAVELASQLIPTYDNPYNDWDQRAAAAKLVVGLAIRYSEVLSLVLKNAQAYAKTVETYGDPWALNSFDVLARIPNNEVVTMFLEEIGQDGSGTCRFMTGALDNLNDPAPTPLFLQNGL